MFYQFVVIAATSILSLEAFSTSIFSNYRSYAARSFKPSKLQVQHKLQPLNMAISLDLAAQPTIEEWIDVCEPGLKKSVLAMFRACKEIAYKIRTASCDKMACFNDFGFILIIIFLFIYL
jgi:hypothetical protein